MHVDTPEAAQTAEEIAQLEETLESLEERKLNMPMGQFVLHNFKAELERDIREGEMGRKLRKFQKQAERDAKVKENFKYCRKKCKLFKANKCWLKTFLEQKECAKTKFGINQ